MTIPYRAINLSTVTSYQFFINSSNINILVLYLVMFLTFMLRLTLYSLPSISLNSPSVQLLLFFYNLKCQHFQGIFLDPKLSSRTCGMHSCDPIMKPIILRELLHCTTIIRLFPTQKGALKYGVCLLCFCAQHLRVLYINVYGPSCSGTRVMSRRPQAPKKLT